MNSQSEEAGFTLLEVAIAMTTVAMLAFGVMFGFTTSSFNDRDAFELQRSQSHAVSLLEQAESFDYATLLAVAGQELVFQVEGMRYSLMITQIQADLIALRATVQNQASGAHRVTLTTLKTMKRESL